MFGIRDLWVEEEVGYPLLVAKGLSLEENKKREYIMYGTCLSEKKQLGYGQAKGIKAVY